MDELPLLRKRSLGPPRPGVRQQSCKAALVTAGAQGIGKAIAKRFAAAGWGVLIADVDAEAGRETAAELGATVHFIRADVGREADVKRCVCAALRRFGGLDALVNNAGISSHKPVTRLTLAEWQRVLAVNLTSIFLAAKYATASLRARRGAILKLASTRALMSEAHTEAYTASKGGVVALTHGLAVSLRPEVRVNCISPGWIATSAWQKKSKRHAPALSAADHAQHLAGRVGSPEDIAELAWYLCTAAGFVTGQNFICDGGMTKKMSYA